MRQRYSPHWDCLPISYIQHCLGFDIKRITTIYDHHQSQYCTVSRYVMVQRSVHDKDFNFVFYNIQMILCCRQGRDLYQSDAVNQPRMRKMSYQYEDIQSQMFCILLEGHSRYYHTIFMIYVGYCVTHKSHTEDVGQFSPLLFIHSVHPVCSQPHKIIRSYYPRIDV